MDQTRSSSRTTKAQAIQLIALSSAIGLLFALYVFEFILWSKEARTGSPGSFNHFLELRSRGDDQTYPLLVPNDYVRPHPDATFQPLTGPADRWMLGFNEMGYWPKFKTDELGFNNAPGAQANPDILLIGDSMVHGVSVQNSENLAGRLAAQGLRVTNLGQGGSGPLTELAILRQYGLRLHAKHVVWLFFCGNDFQDFEVEKKIKALSPEASAVIDADLTTRQRRTDEIWEQVLQSALAEAPRARRREFFRFLRLARVRILVLGRINAPTLPRAPHEDVMRIASIISTAKAEVEATGSTFHFVYLPPTGMQLAWDVFNADGRDLNAALASSGIPSADFGTAVKRQPDPLTLYALGRAAGHYSPKGYQLLSEFVEAAIRGSGPAAGR